MNNPISNKESYSNSFQASWADFYESYDGKFDEKHMLHITIKKEYKNELEGIGYKCQQIYDDWNKPKEGEYKLNEMGDLVIIHSCPDREIFKFHISDFFDELMINDKWVKNAELSVM